MVTISQDLREIAEEVYNINSNFDPNFFAGIERYKYFAGFIDPNLIVIYVTNNRRFFYAFNSITKNGAKLVDIKQAFNTTIRMIFKNTPAYGIQAVIPANSIAYNQVVSTLAGCYLHEAGTVSNTYRITLASLTKDLGIDVVINELLDGGRTTAATKLQNRYNAWVANQ